MTRLECERGKEKLRVAKYHTLSSRAQRSTKWCA